MLVLGQSVRYQYGPDAAGVRVAICTRVSGENRGDFLILGGMDDEFYADKKGDVDLAGSLAEGGGHALETGVWFPLP